MTKLQLAGAAAAALMAASLGACDKTPAPADTGKISDAVKADVAQLVADFNAHDPVKTSAHNAPDVVSMNHGGPNVVGAGANLAAAKKSVADDSSQHVSVADATVDVAASGDMAVYRSTYVFTGTNPKTKATITENGNYLAGYKKQPDGSWKIEWSVVSDTGPAAPPASKG